MPAFAEYRAGNEALLLSPLLARLRPLLAREESPVYLVGGAVRDALLGRPNYDLDFVAATGAIGLAYRIGDALDAPAFVLDRERDVGRVVLEGEGTMLDFARYRGDSLLADLRARDFTINAMALPATSNNPEDLVDPAGGMEDLEAGLLRLVYPEALDDDPVRSLRAVRLATELNYTIVAHTGEAIRNAAAQLALTAVERVREELTRLLRLPGAEAGVTKLGHYSLLPVILPEIAALATVTQSPPHHEDALAHSVHVLGAVVKIEDLVRDGGRPPDPAWHALEQSLAPYQQPLRAHLARPVDGALRGSDLLRLAALFHDTGKPATRTIDGEGRIRFFGHAQQGARLARERLRALRFSNEATRHVELIVQGHMRPLLLSLSPKVTRRAIYRFFRDYGPAGLDIVLLSMADFLATHRAPAPVQEWQALLTVVARLYEHYFENYEETVAPPPLVRGDELMAALGIEAGPLVGRLLQQIEEAQAAGEVTTRGEALALVRGMAVSPQEADD
jgi:putative nucleotidyltransferase with HDIG domain